MLLSCSLHLISFYLLVVHSLESDMDMDKNGQESGQSEKVYCSQEVVTTEDYGDFEFPKTPADKKGTMVRVPCPYGFRNDGYQPISGKGMRISGKEAECGVIRTCYLRASLESGEAIGVWEPSVVESQIKYCKREGWEEDLETWLRYVKTISTTTFIHLGGYLSLIQKHAEDEDYECARELINGLAELLVSPGLKDLNPKDRNRLFDVIESFTQMVSSKVRPGFKLQVGDAGITVETAAFESNSLKNDVKHSYTTQVKASENAKISVHIPPEALEMSMEQSNGGDPHLQITAYSNAIFQKWAENVNGASNCLPSIPPNSTLGCEFSEQGCTDQSPPYKAWGLLCIELDGEIQNLEKPVEFLATSTSKSRLEGSQLTCVYWDETEHAWATKGVTTTQLENGIKCTASHLTAFSALLEPLPSSFPGGGYVSKDTSVHGYILSILSSVGSVCSIVGLGLTLFTYLLFSALRRERSNRILINLSSSLLLMHVMALSGSKSLWDGHCLVPALSIHYLVLTSLAWMMVEAIHMFDLLISVFVRPERRFLIKRVVLAWGIPLIIVGICGAVQPQVYKDGRADLCLMNAHENIYLYYGAFIIPICVMLLINLIIFCRIFRVLYNQTKRTKGMANPGNPGNKTGTSKLQFVKISPLQIKGALAVMVLLGIGWIFGLVAMGPFEMFFRYVFVVANAGQGLLIFLFRVVFNPQACKQWKKVMLGLSPEGSLDVSVTTSSIGSGIPRRKRKSTGKWSPSAPTFISAASSVENSLTASNPSREIIAAAIASILKSEKEKEASAGLKNSS